MPVRRKAVVSAPRVRFSGKAKCGTNGVPVKILRKSAGRPRTSRAVLATRALARAAEKKYREANRKVINARAKAAKRERVRPFRFNAKKYGLTYSQANKIASPQELLDWLQEKLGVHHCTVSMELHTNNSRGKPPGHHFHVNGKLDRNLTFDGCDWFNYEAVDGTVYRPNIIVPNSVAWETYVRKDGFFVTTVPVRPQVMADALQQPTIATALNYIMHHDANAYVRFGNTLEANLQRHYRRTREQILPKYAGPYPASRWPEGWNPETHALHLYGPTGAGKTTYAMHLLRELFGRADFVKGHLESLKSLSFLDPFCFDEVNLLEQCPATSREITDVVFGGTIQARYAPIYIPPGIPRIFTSNSRWVFKNPDESVYGRRLLQKEFLAVAPIDLWRQCDPAPLTPRLPVPETPRLPVPETPRLPIRSRNPPRSPSPPPPPPGTPPRTPRSPPPPPPSPYPWPEVDRVRFDLPEPEAEPDPNDDIPAAFGGMLSRWTDDDTVMHPDTSEAVIHSPVFSPGWDFLLPFNDIPSSVDLFADTLEY